MPAFPVKGSVACARVVISISPGLAACRAFARVKCSDGCDEHAIVVVCRAKLHATVVVAAVVAIDIAVQFVPANNIRSRPRAALIAAHAICIGIPAAIEATARSDWCRPNERQEDNVSLQCQPGPHADLRRACEMRGRLQILLQSLLCVCLGCLCSLQPECTRVRVDTRPKKAEGQLTHGGAQGAFRPAHTRGRASDRVSLHAVRSSASPWRDGSWLATRVGGSCASLMEL